MATTLSPSQFSVLLHDLGVTYGFCLPIAEIDRLKSNPRTEVDSFTDAVFLAEGMNPWSNLHLRRQVKSRIAAAFWDADEPTC
jgi:hypothetical protein